MQAQQQILQSMLYQSASRSRRASAASYGSPAGSSGTYRAASQLLPLDLRCPSDPLSLHDAPQQDPLLTPLGPPSGGPHPTSLAQSRLTRESADSHTSAGSALVDESGPHGSHVVQPGTQEQGGVGARTNLDSVCMSVLQVRLQILSSMGSCSSAVSLLGQSLPYLSLLYPFLYSLHSSRVIAT